MMGHDAKLKAALIAGAIKGSKRAVNQLASLGWTRFLRMFPRLFRRNRP